MAARKPPRAVRAPAPDPLPFPAPTDPPGPGPLSLRARPHRIEYVPCACPGYDTLRLGICVSYSPAEREARRIAIAAEVERRAAAEVAAALQTARDELATATQAAAEAQALADAAPDDPTLAQAATVAAIARQVAEATLAAHQAGQARATADARDEWAFYARALSEIAAWERGTYTGPLPDPADWATWRQDCPDDLLYWASLHSAEFVPAARDAMLPNLIDRRLR